MSIETRLDRLEEQADRQFSEDIKNLSDEELTEIITGGDPDVTTLTDEELDRIIAGEEWPFTEKR